jgi:hypothetical protein
VALGTILAIQFFAGSRSLGLPVKWVLYRGSRGWSVMEAGALSVSDWRYPQDCRRNCYGERIR